MSAIFGRIHVLGLVVAIAVGVFVGFPPAVGVVALFVVVAPFERFFRRHDYRRLRPGLRTDLTYALVQPVTTVIGLIAAIPLVLVFFPIWLPGLALRPLVTAQPGWLMAIEAFILFDLLLYWAHRLAHEVPFFWRFHRIHHSSERLDWIAGIRNHPLDGVFIVGPFVLLTVAGFQLQVVGAAAVVQAVLGIFIHANVRWRLRPLHRIVLTPEFHHWHHANQPEAINTNYSVGLTVWDQLFGTYHMPADARPQVYGTDDPVAPGVIGQLRDPFRGLRLRRPRTGDLRRAWAAVTAPIHRRRRVPSLA